MKNIAVFLVMSLLAGGMYGQERDPVLDHIRASYGEPTAYVIMGRSNFERIQANPSEEIDGRLLSDELPIFSKTPISSLTIQTLNTDALANMALRFEALVLSELGVITYSEQNRGNLEEGAIRKGTIAAVGKQIIRDIKSEYEIKFVVTANGVTTYAAIMRFSCSRPSKEEMREIVKIAERVSYAQPLNTPFIGEFVSNPGGNAADFAGGFTPGFADDKATTEGGEFFWATGNNSGAESSVAPAVPAAYATETAEILKRAEQFYSWTQHIFDADETYQQMLKRGRRIVFGE
jgi:hypothetical protein